METGGLVEVQAMAAEVELAERLPCLGLTQLVGAEEIPVQKT